MANGLVCWQHNPHVYYRPIFADAEAEVQKMSHSNLDPLKHNTKIYKFIGLQTRYVMFKSLKLVALNMLINHFI